MAPAAPAKHGDVSVGGEVGNMRTLATGYHLDASQAEVGRGLMFTVDMGWTFW